MKTKSSKLILTGFASLMITPAFALEAPADNSPPPQMNRPEPTNMPRLRVVPAQANDAAKTQGNQTVEEGAFLGIVSGEVPDCLADHVGLKEGEGVIVRAVVPDSPAGKAGITVNDVITSVGGESVGSPSDITGRIVSHKPGETVTISVIHKGKSSNVDVTLMARPKEIAQMDPHGLDLGLETLPKDMADRIRKELERNAGALDLKLGATDAMPRKMEEAMKEMQKRMQEAMKLGGLPDAELDAPAAPRAGQGEIKTENSATFRMQDKDGSIELKSSNGSKDLTLRDRAGNVTWSGPWNTDTDKAAAPADVQGRMEGLHIDESYKGDGIRFRGVPTPPDEN